MKEQMAYKFRIYPDETQARLFRMTVGCCRFVYNLFLEQKKLERGRSNPRRLTQVDQIKQLPEAKRDFPFLKSAEPLGATLSATQERGSTSTQVKS
jgi:putative transposase